MQIFPGRSGGRIAGLRVQGGGACRASETATQGSLACMPPPPPASWRKPLSRKIGNSSETRTSCSDGFGDGGLSTPPLSLVSSTLLVSGGPGYGVGSQCGPGDCQMHLPPSRVSSRVDSTEEALSLEFVTLLGACPRLPPLNNHAALKSQVLLKSSSSW